MTKEQSFSHRKNEIEAFFKNKLRQKKMDLEEDWRITRGFLQQDHQRKLDTGKALLLTKHNTKAIDLETQQMIATNDPEQRLQRF